MVIWWPLKGDQLNIITSSTIDLPHTPNRHDTICRIFTDRKKAKYSGACLLNPVLLHYCKILEYIYSSTIHSINPHWSWFRLGYYTESREKIQLDLHSTYIHVLHNNTLHFGNNESTYRGCIPVVVLVKHILL